MEVIGLSAAMFMAGIALGSRQTSDSKGTQETMETKPMILALTDSVAKMKTKQEVDFKSLRDKGSTVQDLHNRLDEVIQEWNDTVDHVINGTYNYWNSFSQYVSRFSWKHATKAQVNEVIKEAFNEVKTQFNLENERLSNEVQMLIQIQKKTKEHVEKEMSQVCNQLNDIQSTLTTLVQRELPQKQVSPVVAKVSPKLSYQESEPVNNVALEFGFEKI